MNLFRQLFRTTLRFFRRKYYKLVYVKWFIAYDKYRLRNYTDAIVSVTDGERRNGAGRYAIFIVFPSGQTIDSSTMRAMESLARAEVDVLVVSNIALSEQAMAQLRPVAWRIMHRRNVGFDFGGYKDGVAYLTRECPDLRRLVIVNDSVFYSSVGLDEHFAAMLGEQDVIGAFENWGEGHHVQSFALGISDHVFHSASFQGFWKAYVPVNNRIHAIESGEKALSTAALRAARHSRVVYGIADLLPLLRDDASDEQYEDFIIPVQWRAILLSLGKGRFHARDRYRVLIDIVNVTSPIHSGAYLFPKYMKCPIYKKDLVYRQRFQFWELALLFKDLMPEQEYDDFMLLLRQKGDHKRLTGKQFRLYEIGVA